MGFFLEVFVLGVLFVPKPNYPSGGGRGGHIWKAFDFLCFLPRLIFPFLSNFPLPNHAGQVASSDLSVCWPPSGFFKENCVDFLTKESFKNLWLNRLLIIVFVVDLCVDGYVGVCHLCGVWGVYLSFVCVCVDGYVCVRSGYAFMWFVFVCGWVYVRCMRRVCVWVVYEPLHVFSSH